KDGAVLWSSSQNGSQLHGGDSPYVVSADGWTQPGAGPLRSPFGGRLHPIQRVYKQHEGIDLLAGGRGKPIYAAHDGVVKDVRCDSGGNWTLVINHGAGITTRYLHMDGLPNILVEEGEKGVAGQHVANVGNSGNSTGPHLHFEVRINDEPTDPIAFLAGHGVSLIF
ncbi:MAG: M23 family metallopeptidase, partial [Oscillospiraceae bacterium]|nr:M23 family metallopeptidase [Oscillospiraceae bacterium]